MARQTPRMRPLQPSAAEWEIQSRREPITLPSVVAPTTPSAANQLPSAAASSTPPAPPTPRSAAATTISTAATALLFLVAMGTLLQGITVSQPEAVPKLF